MRFEEGIVRKQLSTFYFLLSTILESKFQHGETDTDEECNQQNASPRKVILEFQQIVSDDKHARHDAQQDKFLDKVEVEDVKWFTKSCKHKIDSTIKDAKRKCRDADSEGNTHRP